MGPLGNRTCAVSINPVLYKDDGIWNITIKSGKGENETSADYTHNVSPTTQGKGALKKFGLHELINTMLIYSISDVINLFVTCIRPWRRQNNRNNN